VSSNCSFHIFQTKAKYYNLIFCFYCLLVLYYSLEQRGKTELLIMDFRGRYTRIDFKVVMEAAKEELKHFVGKNTL